MLTFMRISGAVFILFVMVGCGPSSPESSTDRMPSPPASSPRFTAQSLHAEMARVEASVLAGNGAYLDSIIAVDELLEKVYVGKDRDPALITSFEERAPEHLKVGTQVVGAIQGQGVFRLVKLHEADDGWHAVFRLVSASGILNYHDYQIKPVRGPNGAEPRIVDVYVYSSGETLSRSMQRMYIAMYVGHEADRLANFEGVDVEYGAHLMQLQTIAMMVRESHYPKALMLHLRTPEALQAEKFMLKQRLLIARHVGREAYMEALSACRAAFPDDPAWVLIEMLRFKAEGDDRSFSEMAEVMKKSVGDDPYLIFLQGDALVRQKKADEGIAMIVRAIQMDPLLKPAYWRLLDVHVARKEYDKSVALMRTIRHQLGVMITNLEEKAEYKDFMKSDAYQAWLKEGAAPVSEPAAESLPE